MNAPINASHATDLPEVDNRVAELIRWHLIAHVPPPVSVALLLYSASEEDVFIGTYDGTVFYDDIGETWALMQFTHWAALPVGPARAEEVQS